MKRDLCQGDDLWVHEASFPLLPCRRFTSGKKFLLISVFILVKLSCLVGKCMMLYPDFTK